MKNLDIKNPKIISHNLTFKGIEVVPGVLNFDQRGVIYADTNDIVITQHKPDPGYLDYLSELGWNFENTKFISPENVEKRTYNSIYHDNKINEIVKNSENYYLDTYNTTYEEEDFAKKNNIPLYANCEISQKYGTKSGFRKICKELGLNVPQGVEGVRTSRDALKHVTSMLRTGISEVAIKIDEGISGAGITRIDRSFIELPEIEQIRIIENAISKIKQAGKDSGFSIEEWVSGVLASPSVQYQVKPSGTYKMVSAHDQLLEGKEKWYIGCSYPSKTLTDFQMEIVVKDSEKLVKEFIKQGFIGFFGLDLVITEDGKIYWIEANMRKPGTFYPRIIAEKIFGSLDNIHYFATDFNVEALKGKNFSFLKEILKPFLKNPETDRNGIVLYNVGALFDGGRFDIVCFGSTDDKAVELYKKIKAFLGKYK